MVKNILELDNIYSKKMLLEKDLLLEFDKCFICITSNSEKMIDYLGNYFKSFISKRKDVRVDYKIKIFERNNLDLKMDFKIVKPGFGKTKIKEEYHELENGRIVKKVLTGLIFLTGKEVNSVFGRCLKNANQIVNFINNKYIQWLLEQGGILLHAAGICSNSQGIGICGFSGKGKSTLALKLLENDINFVSNDRLIICSQNEQTKMMGVPKYPRVNPGTIINNENLNDMISKEKIEILKNMEPEQLWELEEKYDVFLENFFKSAKFVLSSNIKSLIILNWDKDKKYFNAEKISLENRKDLIPVFYKEPGIFYYSKKKYSSDYDEYINVLNNINVIEFNGKLDFEEAKNFCMKNL